MANSNFYALWFDGVNDGVSFGSTGLPTGDSSRTVEFWMKPEDNNSYFKALVSWGNNTTLQKFDVGLNPDSMKGYLCVHAWGEMVVTEFPVINSYNTWYHIAVVYSGGGLITGAKMYVNGNEVKLVAKAGYGNTNPLNTQATNLWVGRRTDGHYFKGIIDEVRIWSLARVKAQIDDARYKVLTGSEAGLVGYWRFEEGLGTVALDSSLSANHGTLSNGATFVAGEIGLLAGQKVEEIGIPIDISKGTFNNLVYEDGRLQLKKLYPLNVDNGGFDPTYVGEGTAEKPYLIKTALDFFNMRWKPYSYFKMVNDIDFGVPPFDYGQYYGFDFYGTLDGNGYKIKNMKIVSNINYTGLFKRLYDKATVKNLFIEDIFVECVGDFAYQGIIAGQMTDSSSIDNVRVTGTIKTRGRSGTLYCGTIGYMAASSKITNAYIAVNIDLDEAGLSKDYIGIVTGRFDSGCSISQVIVEGNLIGTTNSFTYNGIIIGYNYKSNIRNVYCNKDLMTLGIPVTNNVAIANADKTELELQDAKLYETWSSDVWRIKMWSKPKLKMFDKPTDALVEYGEWESDVIDMVDKYTSLNKLVRMQNIFEGAKVVILTKTSDDNVTWTPYVALTEDGKVQSPKARYAKVKVIIYASKDREVSEIEGFNGLINYDKDPYIKTDVGKLTLENSKKQEFTKDTSYTGGGYLYKTKISVGDKRQINKIKLVGR